MRTVDFSPLFRSAIGFDRLFDLAEAAQRVGKESYPPYNIECLDEKSFQISVALAEFVEVRDARSENGPLIIDLQREIPEAMKPRRIAINSAAPSNVTQIES